MICPRCGTENEDRNVCKKCGEFLSIKTKRIVDPEEQKKFRRKKILDFIKSFFLSFGLILVALVVLSVIMFAVFYFVFDKMDLGFPDPSDLTTPVTTEASAAPSEEEGAPDAAFAPGVMTLTPEL